VFAPLAFAVSGLTPNAEPAQLTVLPIMFACMRAPGSCPPGRAARRAGGGGPPAPLGAEARLTGRPAVRVVEKEDGT
jgi:hypothetical protein